MSDNRMVKKIYKWKPITTRLQGRPKSRWDDNVKQYICKMRMNNWTVCVQDRGNGEMSLKRVKLSIYEVVKPREEDVCHHGMNFVSVLLLFNILLLTLHNVTYID
jgi:hypothetical protein